MRVRLELHNDPQAPPLMVLRQRDGFIVLMLEGACTLECSRMARAILTEDERNAFRALFGVGPVAEDPHWVPPAMALTRENLALLGLHTGSETVLA